MKLLFNLFWLVIFFIKESISEKILKIPFFYLSRQYYINIYFGTPSHEALHVINTNLTFTWTIKYFYYYKASNTSKFLREKEIKVLKSDKMMTTDEVEDVVGLVNDEPAEDSEQHVQLKNFSFYSTNFSSLPHLSNHGVGFAFKIEERFSLVHLLFNEGYIDKRSFAFASNPVGGFYQRNFMLIGGTPQNLLEKQYSYKGSCQVSRDEVSWSCNLKSILLQNFKEFNFNNKKIFFNPFKENLIFEKDFYSYLINKVFESDIKQDLCHFKGKLLFCQKKATMNKGNISFLVGNSRITFDCKFLFRSCITSCEAAFEEGNRFIFGTTFISRFFIEFNYDEEKISFYTNQAKIEEDFKKEKFNYIKFFFCFIIVICLFGGVAHSLTIKLKLNQV